MSRRNALAVLVSLSLFVVSPGGASAGSDGGTFHIRGVWYHTIDSEFTNQVKVLVLAESVFRGPKRTVPHFWIIQTMLNDSYHSTNLRDWDNPVFWGEGFTGTWIPEPGETYVCGLGCAVEARVPLCTTTDEPVSFVGRGAIGIYTDPAAKGSSRTGPVETTTCLFSVSGTVSGLTGDSTVILANNGSDFLTVDAKGGSSFTFPQRLHDGDEYSITVAQQPAGALRCSVDPRTAAGHIDREDVQDVKVSCVTTCRAGAGAVLPGGDYNAPYGTEAACWPEAKAVGCSSPQLVDRGNGTVADLANNLLWTWDFVGTQRVDAIKATKLCADLDLGGRQDWRKPDIAQLQTLQPDCQGVMANCGSNGDPTSLLYWSSSGYVTPDDCIVSGVCDCHFDNCAWVALLGPHNPYMQCQTTGFRERDSQQLTRCVTELVP